MRIVLFCHSLLSCWNHGTAHFLRGVVTEFAARGHDVRVFEPRDAWSVENLVRDHGEGMLHEARAVYPWAIPYRYDRAALDLDDALSAADLVLVHEWNDHALVGRIGEHRKRSGSRYALLFHDTHHRSVTDDAAMGAYDLSGYDGVLAFGAAVRDVYERRGWAKRAFIWHEAADVRVFRPRPEDEQEGDVVWIGNWGDGERAAALVEFLLEPVRSLGLRAKVHGIRYPDHARALLVQHGVDYAGWLPSFRAPEVFSRHRVTVHVPSRPYADALPGSPTIRVLEALACGIPLVSAPWRDTEGLFSPGEDFLVARDGAEMKAHLAALTADASLRRSLVARGRSTVLARHTCAHRVDELLGFARELGARVGPISRFRLEESP